MSLETGLQEAVTAVLPGPPWLFCSSEANCQVTRHPMHVARNEGGDWPAADEELNESCQPSHE